MPLLFNYSGINNCLNAIVNSVKGINNFNYNAKFILSVGSGIVELNPETGNYDLVTTTAVTIKAQLMPMKELNENINIGTPFTKFYLEGHLYDPLNYNGEFNNYLECELLNDGSWLKGKFYPQLTLNTPLIESFSLRSALGSQIKGYFEINGNLSN
jgi:hypothetical protein